MPVADKINLKDGKLYSKDDKDILPMDIAEIFSRYGNEATHIRMDFIASIMGYTLGIYTPEHAAVLSNCLKDYNGPLVSLDLCGCNIDDAGMIQILSAIIENQLLRDQINNLEISNNAIGVPALSFLLENVLPVCSNLVIRELRGQPLGSVTEGRCKYDQKKAIENREDTAPLVLQILAFREATPMPISLPKNKLGV